MQTKKDENLEKFGNQLTSLITGYDLSKLDSSIKDKIQKKSLNIYQKHIINFIKKNYGSVNAYRIKYIQNTEIDNFKKFPELNQYFQEAHENFIKHYTK